MLRLRGVGRRIPPRLVQMAKRSRSKWPGRRVQDCEAPAARDSYHTRLCVSVCARGAGDAGHGSPPMATQALTAWPQSPRLQLAWQQRSNVPRRGMRFRRLDLDKRDVTVLAREPRGARACTTVHGGGTSLSVGGQSSLGE